MPRLSTNFESCAEKACAVGTCHALGVSPRRHLPDRWSHSATLSPISIDTHSALSKQMPYAVTSVRHTPDDVPPNFLAQTAVDSR